MAGSCLKGFVRLTSRSPRELLHIPLKVACVYSRSRTSVRLLHQSTRLSYSALGSTKYDGFNSNNRTIKSSALCFQYRSQVCHNSSLAAGLSASAVTNLTDGSSLGSNELSGLSDGLVSALASASEPTLASLGLGGSSPSGFVQSALEMLHTGLDVPWWGAIVIGTICIRLAIFPLVIVAQRNAANMHNNLPTMTRLQEKMMIARREGDLPGAMKASKELTDYMKRNDVNPFKNLLPPLAQVPIFMSVFFGIREMASLPVESLKTGGILWFTDLTIADPYYALPLLTATTLMATIELGVDGIKADQMQQQMKFIFRLMPFICFPFISQFPAAMLCYWCTSNAISLIQVLFLRLPGVKPFFKIPAMIKHDVSATKYIKPLASNQPKVSFMEAFRESMKNAKLAAEMEERRRYNSLKMKEPIKAQRCLLNTLLLLLHRHQHHRHHHHHHQHNLQVKKRNHKRET